MDQKIVELDAALTRARADVANGAAQVPELPAAEMLNLKVAAHKAWRELEEAISAGGNSESTEPAIGSDNVERQEITERNPEKGFPDGTHAERAREPGNASPEATDSTE